MTDGVVSAAFAVNVRKTLDTSLPRTLPKGGTYCEMDPAVTSSTALSRIG